MFSRTTVVCVFKLHTPELAPPNKHRAPAAAGMPCKSLSFSSGAPAADKLLICNYPASGTVKWATFPAKGETANDGACTGLDVAHTV